MTFTPTEAVYGSGIQIPVESANWMTSVGVSSLAGQGGTGATSNYGGNGLYGGAPSVSISGGGGSGATATAVFTKIGSGGFVTSVIVNNGGSGYTTPPTVTFGYNGAGNATGTAVILNGQVVGVNVTPFSIGMATPVITWANPTDITYGTKLSGAQLDATANTAGTIVYSSPSDTLLSAGQHQALSLTFYPADTADYTSPVTDTVYINVNQAMLTITAPSPTIVYGQAIPTLTPSYSGFVNSEGPGNLTTLPTVTTTATTTSDPGMYPVTAVGAVDPNYAFVYVAGSLTITQDGTGVNLASTSGSSSFGASVTLTATVTANAPGSGTPMGTVDFFDNTTGVDLTPIPMSLSAGSASLSIATLPVGAKSITATYSGSTDFVGMTGSTTQTVVVADYVLNSAAHSPLLGGAAVFSSGAVLNIPGQLIIDSPAKPALTASGTSQVIASYVGIAGTYSKGSTATISTPSTGIAAVTNPLAGLTAPQLTGSPTSINLTSGSLMINPGIYNQIKVSGTGNLTLNPGNYVIAGGGLSVTNSASLTGIGVTIDSDSNAYPNAGGTYSGIALNTTGVVTLSAPATGSYAGILFYLGQSNTSVVSLSAGSTSTLSGIIDAPASQLSVTGAIKLTDALIVGTLSMGGAAVENDLPTNVGNGGIAYSPDQVRAAYGINAIGAGASTLDGTGQTIAIVDAYDDPSIFAAVDAFDSQFGLVTGGSTLYAQYGPAWSFLTVLNGSGQSAPLPATDPAGPGVVNWELETALDVEWAHAIAPGARIVLVEANSQSLSDLMAGVKTAAAVPGVSVVSMSWGFAEGQTVFAADEAQYDSIFNVPGVTFVASTGDYAAADAEYPAFSPNVVAVGGSSLTLHSDNSYGGEIGWGYNSAAAGAYVGSGGGISLYEPEPSYQQGVQSTGYRTTPDVSMIADPATGAWIADTYNLASSNPFEVVGGTSLSAPSWAGLFALVNQGRAAAGEAAMNSSNPGEAQQALYSLPQTDYNVVSGGNNGYTANAGYNLVTGLGTPIASSLVPDLVQYAGPGTTYAGPTVGPLQNATYTNPGTSGSGETNVFCIFDAMVGGGQGAMPAGAADWAVATQDRAMPLAQAAAGSLLGSAEIFLAPSGPASAVVVGTNQALASFSTLPLTAIPLSASAPASPVSGMMTGSSPGSQATLVARRIEPQHGLGRLIELHPPAANSPALEPSRTVADPSIAGTSLAGREGGSRADAPAFIPSVPGSLRIIDSALDELIAEGVPLFAEDGFGDEGFAPAIDQAQRNQPERQEPPREAVSWTSLPAMGVLAAGWWGLSVRPAKDRKRSIDAPRPRALIPLAFCS